MNEKVRVLVKVIDNVVVEYPEIKEFLRIISKKFAKEKV